jgi:hypothetical protein
MVQLLERKELKAHLPFYKCVFHAPLCNLGQNCRGVATAKWFDRTLSCLVLVAPAFLFTKFFLLHDPALLRTVGPPWRHCKLQQGMPRRQARRCRHSYLRHQRANGGRYQLRTTQAHPRSCEYDTASNTTCPSLMALAQNLSCKFCEQVFCTTSVQWTTALSGLVLAVVVVVEVGTATRKVSAPPPTLVLAVTSCA